MSDDTKAALVEEAAAEPSLSEMLPPELLKEIAEQLAADEDVLRPRQLACLARTCKVIKAAVKDALDKLKVEHQKAVLFRKLGTTFERLVAERPAKLNWNRNGLVAADAPALTNVLKIEAVAQVESLYLYDNKLGDEGAAAIAAAAAGGGTPRLKTLLLADNQIGDAGMQALASAFAAGAFRELEQLNLGGNAGTDRNEIGDAGLAALAEALEKGALPALKELYLDYNEIGDEGVKALMAAAGAGWLAKLEGFLLTGNEFGEEGVETLAEAIINGNLPSLKWLRVDGVLKWMNPRLMAACEERGIEM